jgi:acyl carrier protein
VWGDLYSYSVPSRGYLGNTALTQQRFIINPFTNTPADRLFKTEDRGRHLADGSVECLGPTDYQVKVRGFRIELGEIETAMRVHPGVFEAVVVTNEKDGLAKSLVGYIVPRQDAAPTAGELRRFLRQRLPEYMVPSSFVCLGSLPLTPNGKIDRAALPPPDQRRSKQGEVDVAPRTPAEQLLAEIWAEVLRLDKVGIRDNFFELGGHSLLATQVVSRVRKRLLVELPLRVLFENATVASLSEHIEAIQSIKGEDQETVTELSDEREEIRM